MVDLNTMTLIKTIEGFEDRVYQILYLNGLLFITTVDQVNYRVYYCNPSEENPVPTFLLNGSSSNSYNGQIVIKNLNTFNLKFYDIGSGVPIEVGTMAMQPHDPIYSTIVVDNLYYVLQQRRIDIYDLDTKTLIKNKKDLDVSTPYTVIRTGDLLVINDCKNTLWIVDRHNLNILKIEKFLFGINKMLVYSGKIYVALANTNNYTIDLKTFKLELVVFNVDDKVVMLDIHHDKLYYEIISDDKYILAELNLLNSDKRVGNDVEIGISNVTAYTS